MKKKLSEKAWFPYTVAACIAVILYTVLTHLGSVTNGIETFFGYFNVVFLGLILAYIINPLAKFVDKKLLYRIRNEKLEWTLSVFAALIIILLLLAFILGTLIPQLIDSITTFLNNLDGYVDSLKTLIDRWGLSDTVNIDNLLDKSGSAAGRLRTYLAENAGSIVTAGVGAGRRLASAVIAFILSIYVLLNKSSLKAGVLKLMHAAIPKKPLDRMLNFLTRCDTILVRYIVFSVVDAIIIGAINALFMAITGMEYIGIVTLVVAVANLIPTFGPIVGGAIGALILLLVKPLHALIFIVFTFALQFVDAYFIKPKLFGSTLGVSGLLILISVLVFGSMFGVIGMLLAIPIAAILDFTYREALLPWLEKRTAAREAGMAESEGGAD